MVASPYKTGRIHKQFPIKYLAKLKLEKFILIAAEGQVETPCKNGILYFVLFHDDPDILSIDSKSIIYCIKR